jgi:hypothetical protein
MMYRTEGHSRARYYYDRLADEARKDGRDDIAAIAELRSAIRHLPQGSEMQMAEIRKIASLQGERMRAPVLEAKLALAKAAYQKGDEAGAQAIQNELAQLNIKRPMLIYQPSYAMVQRELDSGSEFNFPMEASPAIGGEPTGIPTQGASAEGRASVTNSIAAMQWSSTKRMAGNFDDMWADVSFRITPDGRVSDVKITRSKGDLFWTKPLLASLSMRRYTAGKLNDPASMRSERYTYTSGYEGQTGTRAQQRSPKARVEYMDLSDIASVE